MGIVRDLYYARKMSAGLKLPAPTVALLIKRLRLAAAMGGGIEKTVSGSPAHITDALAKAALSVLVNITPIQPGSGDPSPENVRPISGLTGLSVYRTGKNLLDPNRQIDVSATTLANMFAAYIASGVYGKGYYNGTSIVTNNLYWTTFTPCVPGETYTIRNTVDTFSRVAFLDDSGNVVTISGGWPTSYTHTALSNEKYILASFNTENVGAVQLELGSSATTYEPFNGNTYAVDWTTQAGTVYHGTVDVVSGELTVDMVNIPSYNGETINEPWLSSMDAYAAGTTPTIGAQVVYTLDTPLTYQLSAQEVQMLLGENNVWSSSGDTVSVTYYAEGNANPLQSLNILLGGRYSNPKTADDVSDKEALEIILGGNK